MPPSPNFILNGLAWIGIFLLIALAFVLVQILGFPGVLILGLLTTLICLRAEISEDVPTWSQALFASRASRSASAEERAATAEARARAISPLRYVQGCGFVLIAAGLAGTVWQLYR
ncbi:hypothetical protein SAMN02745194_04683 [Roseomonas rosea]|uniref:Uncharacterized protein n=1 Tax=Muricoccus roseus TaxID=198092 RepID=A0A1M6RH27_9PROT|nr:hypothetical protein [Roseomonas rosea]SHK31765.1 hypothetical protein SAMN02745194_04683 [Roseomonas rosea]